VPVRPRNPTLELVSMAIVFGLLVGSVITGVALYGSGVACLVRAPKEGLSVLADGRDTGVRTPISPSGEGSATSIVRVRLKPGHHTLELRGVGAPEMVKELEVASGSLCEASFLEEHP
jgi:hypothetical protein